MHNLIWYLHSRTHISCSAGFGQEEFLAFLRCRLLVFWVRSFQFVVSACCRPSVRFPVPLWIHNSNEIPLAIQRPWKCEKNREKFFKIWMGNRMSWGFIYCCPPQNAPFYCWPIYGWIWGATSRQSAHNTSHHAEEDGERVQGNKWRRTDKYWCAPQIGVCFQWKRQRLWHAFTPTATDYYDDV